MKKSIGIIISVALLFCAGMASAAPILFTLDSYNVSLNETDPGLKLYWSPLQSTPVSGFLDVGFSQTFPLFRIGTTERSVELDDIFLKPISVSFVWSAPPGVVPDSANGVTFGVFRLFQDHLGTVVWTDPAIFTFGNGGEFRITLENDSFGTPGFADINATFCYVKASVPEPMSLLLLGLGLLGIGVTRRKN
jgi:hypothetical protein